MGNWKKRWTKAASVLALAGLSVGTAQAVPVLVPLGTLTTPQTKLLPSQNVAIGSFSFDFSFTTTEADIFSADGLTYDVLGGTSGLRSFAAAIDGHSFAASSGTHRIGNRTAFKDILSYSTSDNLVLASGVYHLLVSGEATKASTLNGAFNLVAAPVPEPGTYALMLAGLGVMGVVARRRKAKQTA